MSVVEAVERDLAEIAKRDPALAESALAALARRLAELIDNPSVSATSISMNAGRLQDALTQLRELTPDEAVQSPLDEIRERRDKKLRRAG